MQEVELKILKSFFPFIDNLYTTKEIENRSGYSHERVHNVLNELINKGMVIKQMVGRSNVYRFNKIHPDFLLVYAYYLSEKRKKFEKDPDMKIVNEIIERIGDRHKSIVIFERNKNLNVLCISDKINVDEIASELADRPSIVLSVDEFNEMKDKDREFFNNIVESGIALDGIEFFHKLVYGK